MAKYKVLTIALAVKNNRVARFGEEVSESELTVNPSELVKLGALELLESEEDTIEVEAEVVESETEKVEESEAKTETVEPSRVDEKPLTAKDKAQAGLKK